jgi:TolB-like protein
MKKSRMQHNVCIVASMTMCMLMITAHSVFAYEKELKALSAEIAGNIAKTNKTKVAVVDFTDLKGNVTELGRFIAEELSVGLQMAGKNLEVVDRTHLQTLLKEHKLSSTGLVDPASSRKLGQIAGVDALITGTITPFGETIRLSAKIIDTESAKLIGANTGNIPATEAIKMLLASGIESGGVWVEQSGTTAPVKLQAQQSIEIEGITFNLQGCYKKGVNVECHLLLTSIGQDRQLYLWASRDGYSSTLLDDRGDAYYAKTIWLGNSNSGSSGYLSNRLFADTPMKVVVYFEQISAQSDAITMLIIQCGFDNYGSAPRNGGFVVRFPNVPFSK